MGSQGRKSRLPFHARRKLVNLLRYHYLEHDMKNVGLLGSAVVLVGMAVASAQLQSSDVAKTLEQMEQRWADAAKKQDAKPLADMLSDDYLLTITTGQVVDKESY